MILPEFILLRVLNEYLDDVRTDYNLFKTNNNIPNSFLGRITGEMMRVDDYDQLESAVDTLLLTNEDPDKFVIKLSYDFSTNKTPFAFITLGNEQETNNSFSQGEGDVLSEYVLNADGTKELKHFKQRRFTATYQIVIGGENKNQVVLLYHIIKSIIILSYGTLDDEGLERIRISGSDIKLNPNIPDKIFLQHINVMFDYEQSVPMLINEQMLEKVKFAKDYDGTTSPEPPVPTS